MQNIIITATNLPRFMACNGSRLVEGFTPSIQTNKKERDEGDAAHWLIEQVCAGNITAEELVDRKAANGIFITAEMVEHTRAFIYAHGGMGEVEVDTSFSGTHWQINGRTDRRAFYSNTLHIDDFKYGFSIVEPEMNWTLIAHAIGDCIKNRVTPEWIVLTIYQPRAVHPDGRVREWRISYAELMEFYNQINQTLSNPSDILNSSKHCKGCPAVTNCPAYRKAQMNALDVSEKAFTDVLNNDDLAFILDEYERAIEILKTSHTAYTDLALQRVRMGQHVRNYAAEIELTNKVWHDAMTVETSLILTGKNITRDKKELITPTQAIAAGVDPRIVDAFSGRRNKGVKLVRVDEQKKAQKAFGKRN